MLKSSGSKERVGLLIPRPGNGTNRLLGVPISMGVVSPEGVIVGYCVRVGE